VRYRLNTTVHQELARYLMNLFGRGRKDG
jgi:hypothetical protein